MSISSNLRRRIMELEQKLWNSEADVEAIRRELDILKRMEFEEEMKSDDNRKLLKG